MKQKTIKKLENIKAEIKEFAIEVGKQGLCLNDAIEILKALSNVEKAVDISINRLNPKGSTIPKTNEFKKSRL